MLVRRIGLFIVLATMSAVTSELQAQNSAAIKLERDYEDAFSRILRDPADMDSSFRHAELAIKIGDFEGAISSLERMLLYNSELPGVRLELGVLYFRLGSYAIARSYLTSAVRGAEVPAEVKAKVEKFLREIKKRDARHSFSGSIYSGGRYQTNANGAPERLGLALGVPASVTTANRDFSAFIAGSLKYVFDPQSATGEVIEVQLLNYVSQQSREDELDLVYIDGSVGPRGRFMPNTFERVSWRPYMSLSYVALANSRYYFSYGAGIGFEKKFTPATTGTLEFSHEERRYRADNVRSAARLYSGETAEVSGTVKHQINSWLQIGGKIGIENTDAEASYNSNREFTIGLNTTFSYDALARIGAETWVTTFDTTVRDADYRAPDASVEPDRRRHDREVRASLTTTIPIDQSWALITTLERTRVNSNILNYDYTNSSISIGASFRF